MLGRAGITQSHLGKGGGATLARSAAEITLADVYRAVEDGELLAMPRCAPDASCRIGANIGALVVDAVRRAETSFEAELSKSTIGELVEKLTAITA